MLCWGPEQVILRGVRQTVELGTVHCITYSDNEMVPTCHHIPRYLAEDREEAQRMGGQKTWDALRRISEDLRAVPCHHPKRGVGVLLSS